MRGEELGRVRVTLPFQGRRIHEGDGGEMTEASPRIAVGGQLSRTAGKSWGF